MSRSYSGDGDGSGAWEWDFLGKATADIEHGRKYYRAISSRRLSDDWERIYNVGDAVVLNSGDGALWVAQLVNLYEESYEEYETRRMRDSFPVDESETCKHMRCTLRWFESPGDLSSEAQKLSKVPQPLEDEIYVSDHVENEGFNCVTDIKGMAFLMPSNEERERFDDEPDPRYMQETDRVCVVRGFANSSVDNVVRVLDDGELECILKYPCQDRRLHDNSFSLFFQTTQYRGSNT